MAKFFTSPMDLLTWVKENNSNAGEATLKITAILQNDKHHMDIAETTKRIFAGQNPENASQVLFDILSGYDITEKQVKQAQQESNKVIAANELLHNKQINAAQHAKLVKEAQIMRQPGEYQFPLRVCPKLPYSVGNRRISTYNCIHYCQDSMTLDDDPNRVYCLEAMWRKHVMDKFSSNWQDKDTGELIGGYIDNRFHVFPNAGTPDNPDVPRNHGNPMELSPTERTRQPRPHEYSMERRLEEQRNPGSTKSITLANSQSPTKIAQGLSGMLVNCSYPYCENKIARDEDNACDECLQMYCHDHLQEDTLNGTNVCLKCQQEDEAVEQRGRPRSQELDFYHAHALSALITQGKSNGFIKLAANDVKNPANARIATVFSHAIELQNQGIAPDEAIAIMARHHGMKVEDVYRIQSTALRKLQAHQADVYMIKTAQVSPNQLQTVPEGQQITTSEGYILPAGSTFAVVGNNGQNSMIEVQLSTGLDVPRTALTVATQELLQINPQYLPPEDAAAHLVDMNEQLKTTGPTPPPPTSPMIGDGMGDSEAPNASGIDSGVSGIGSGIY